MRFINHGEASQVYFFTLLQKHSFIILKYITHLTMFNEQVNCPLLLISQAQCQFMGVITQPQFPFIILTNWPLDPAVQIKRGKK